MRYAVVRDGIVFKTFIGKHPLIFNHREDAERCAKGLNDGRMLGSKFKVREVE